MVIDNLGCEVVVLVEVIEFVLVEFNFIVCLFICNGFFDGGVGVNQVFGGLGMMDIDYIYMWEDGFGDIVRNDFLGGVIYFIMVVDV